MRGVWPYVMGKDVERDMRKEMDMEESREERVTTEGGSPGGGLQGALFGDFLVEVSSVEAIDGGLVEVLEVEENPGKEDVGVVRGGERVGKGMLVKGV